MNSTHVRPGRTAKRERQARVGQETGSQVWNAETKEWEQK